MCKFTREVFFLREELFQVSMLSRLFFHIVTLRLPLSHSLVARRRKIKKNIPHQDLNRGNAAMISSQRIGKTKAVFWCKFLRKEKK